MIGDRAKRLPEDRWEASRQLQKPAPIYVPPVAKPPPPSVFQQPVNQLVEKYSVEKIRTIGDNYMVASGVPSPRVDHANALAALALDMLNGLKQLPEREGKRVNCRLGINSGPVVAGVIGKSKFQYDIWGDTVNDASRMESHGDAGKIHISASTYELIKDDFECEYGGATQIKGKDELETWYLVGPKNS